MTDQHKVRAVAAVLPPSVDRPLPITVKWDSERQLVHVTGVTNKEGLAIRNAHPQFYVTVLPEFQDEPFALLFALKPGPHRSACEACGSESFRAYSHSIVEDIRLHSDYYERLSTPNEHHVAECKNCGTRRLIR